MSETALSEWENSVSGARISGTVYQQLNKELKSRYVKVKAKKGKATPPEAKK
jgi:hypothetical protein